MTILHNKYGNLWENKSIYCGISNLKNNKPHCHTRHDLVLRLTTTLRTAINVPKITSSRCCISISELYALVRHPYTAAHCDELSLVEGDVILVLDQNLPYNGWWKGELNGQVGVFPDNFVKLLPEYKVAFSYFCKNFWQQRICVQHSVGSLEQLKNCHSW